MDTILRTKIRDICYINKNNLNGDINFKEYLYLDTGNITDNRIGDIQVIDSKENLPSRAKRLVKPGDTIISTVRPIQRHFGILDNPNENLLVSTGFAVLTPKKDIVNDYYLYYYLTQPKMTHYFQMMAESSVTSYPSITTNVIENVEIDLPPLEKQNEIVKVINSFSVKHHHNLEQIELLKEYCKLLFYKWFIDFNFPNKKGEPYKDSGGDFIKTKKKSIPMGWQIGEFGDVLDIQSGKRNTDFKEKAIDNYTIPVYGASEIIGYSNEFLYDEPIIITGRVGTHGVLMREHRKSWPSDNTLVIKSKNYEFAFQLLNWFDFSKLNIGSTQPLITQTRLKKQKLVLPPKEIIDKFELSVKPLMDKINELQNENDLLIEVRDLLVYKLIK